MVEYKFTKHGIKEMYHDTCLECFEKLTDETIDEMYIKVEMGNQFVKIPMDADSLEILSAALKECVEVFEED